MNKNNVPFFKVWWDSSNCLIPFETSHLTGTYSNISWSILLLSLNGVTNPPETHAVRFDTMVERNACNFLSTKMSNKILKQIERDNFLNLLGMF